MALSRNHRNIAKQLHYVRNSNHDEDRCRFHVLHMPRNLSRLTSATIAIVRCNGQLRNLPEANRHYAARAKEALHAITERARRMIPRA